MSNNFDEIDRIKKAKALEAERKRVAEKSTIETERQNKLSLLKQVVSHYESLQRAEINNLVVSVFTEFAEHVWGHETRTEKSLFAFWDSRKEIKLYKIERASYPSLAGNHHELRYNNLESYYGNDYDLNDIDKPRKAEQAALFHRLWEANYFQWTAHQANDYDKGYFVSILTENCRVFKAGNLEAHVVCLTDNCVVGIYERGGGGEFGYHYQVVKEAVANANKSQLSETLLQMFKLTL
jgi:hypothetical protein